MGRKRPRYYPGLSCLPPVVVVHGDLAGLLERVGLGHLEGGALPGRRSSVPSLWRGRLGLLESVGFGHLGIDWHVKVNLHPAEA